uniref:Uncharacterized protein n=1 Tax=Callorhinchus milii TaxID=7868 RepID=A0A4W3HMX4_CALMI
MQYLQSFVQVFPDLKRCIRGYIKELRDIADDTDKCQDSSNIIKVKGSSMRMVGAILGLGGVIAAPCTEGISLVLTAVGTGMVIAGNATNFTARVGSSIKRMKKKRLTSRSSFLTCLRPSSLLHATYPPLLSDPNLQYGCKLFIVQSLRTSCQHETHYIKAICYYLECANEDKSC